MGVVRPDRLRDTAHLYGPLAPLGQLRQGRLDLDAEHGLVPFLGRQLLLDQITG